MTITATTLDGILNRRVMLEQPETGYRVAVDTVFLAAAVPARVGDRVLDLGCGVGGAMLALACRVAGITGIGIDNQPELIHLCRVNIERNSFASGFEAQLANATQLPSDFYNAFDHVLANPPYHHENSHDASPDKIKRGANTEKDGELGVWMASAAAALKSGGTLTIIHRADRLEEILACLSQAFGAVEILPLLPKAGVEAKRVILRARKGGDFLVRECRPLALHKSEGGYTAEADAVLRGGAELEFSAKENKWDPRLRGDDGAI